MSARVNQITAANLRAAAVLLDQHPDIPQPYIVTSHSGAVRLSWYLSDESDGKALAARVVRSIDGAWGRGEADYSGPLATWNQVREGLNLHVSVARDQVCERVVTGTKVVTIPAVEAQPARTEEREVVEWRCMPLLAEATPLGAQQTAPAPHARGLFAVAGTTGPSRRVDRAPNQ